MNATATAKPKQRTPAKVIRDDTDRAIAASIWEREGQEGIPYFTYTISRSYKSKAGKDGHSADFYGRNATAIGIGLADQAIAVGRISVPPTPASNSDGESS